MKYFFLFILSLATYGTANAAAFTGSFFKGYSKLPQKDTDTVVRKRSVYVRENYGSDIQFFGRTGPITFPYLSTDVIYNFKTGFFIYGTGVNLLGYDPLLDEVDLGTGYLFKYSKSFSGTISYTRFFFNKEAAYVIKSGSTNDINFKNAFDWKFAKSSITFDYLFGKENDYFVTLNTSKYIETNWNIFDDKDFLSFNPTISAILGTQNFVGEYSSQFQFRPYITDALDPDGKGRPIAAGSHYNNGRFNALNYSFKLPVAYNRPHYSLEAAYKYAIPVDVEGELKNRREGFFYLTLYYVFY